MQQIRELMERMGHAGTRAAMIYQHSTGERQREVARTLDDLARGTLNEGSARNGHGRETGLNEDQSPDDGGYV